MSMVRSMTLQSNNKVSGSKTSATALKERTAEIERHKAAIAAKKKAVKIARGKKTYDNIKRTVDIVGSAVGMLVLLPVFLLISLLIMAERSGKHVFFKQCRLGMGGKPIYIYKFRTMIDNAEDVTRWLNEEQLKQYYSEYKVEDDPRVTKVGKFLRRTGLDELPQLLNILKGELSIVGPRPIQESETVLYGKDKDLLLSIRPGLTGYWQAYCSGDTTYTNRKRQRMEIHYVLHRNLLWDLKICLATFGAIVRKVKRGQ
ncbi:MAG: sugar transferase [Oscillospiraceae bacterium]|nr:sugar transferase [Oscillospiraceae bacterium]